LRIFITPFDGNAIALGTVLFGGKGYFCNVNFFTGIQGLIRFKIQPAFREIVYFRFI